ncbi:MAG: CARDB domain-containing protein [Syntrophomonas sp.]
MGAKQSTLDVSGKNIVSLDGLQDFEGTGMWILKCANNSISVMPVLPSTVFQLEAGHNKLTSLPALPTGLRELAVGSNNLTALPTFPNSLEDLVCDSNQLTTIPAMPAGLKTINCENNKISTLPTLSANLTELYCPNNQLSSLPTLPPGLKGLRCYKNNLSILPALPSTLTLLQCNDNKLNSLPNLPSNLTDLICSNNQLTGLPPLPSKLVNLLCHHNKISGLGGLPSNLLQFECNDNQLHTLPALPAGLQKLYCQNNSISVLTNLPANLTALHCAGNCLTDLPALPSGLSVFHCDRNYMDIFSNGTGTLKTRLSSVSCSDKTITPQYRCYYNGATVTLSKNGTKDVSSSIIRQISYPQGNYWKDEGVPGLYLVYSSSKPAIATIDPDSGLVTAHNAGSCTIYADLGGVNSIFTRVSIPVTVVNSSVVNPGESNNKPDLIVKQISAPSTVVVGGTIAVTNAIDNIGKSGAGAFTVKFYLSTDTTINSSDIYLGQREVSNLVAGGDWPETTTLNISNFIALGTYYVGAIVDPDNKINEAVESNNTGYGPYTIEVKKAVVIQLPKPIKINH